MPRGKGSSNTVRRTGGAKAKAPKKAQNIHDSDSENESTVDNTESKMDRYDATMHDNGEDGDGDERDDWGDDGDGEDVDDPDADGDDEDNDNGGDDDLDLGGDVGDGGEGGDDDCSYNVARKSKGAKKLGAVIDKEDDDDDDGADGNADENELNEELYVKPEDRRAVGHLTQYERVRLLGDRTAQLAQGAKPMIKGTGDMDPRIIAQLELESKMMPLKVIRPLPDGKKEKWSLSELRLKKKYIIYGFTGGEVDEAAVKKIKAEYQKGGSIIGYQHLTNTIKTVKGDTSAQQSQSKKTKVVAAPKSKSKTKTKSKSKSNSVELPKKSKTSTKTASKTSSKKTEKEPVSDVVKKVVKRTKKNE
ncbi:DNA-directed RNA polymerase subunit 6 [Yasminevirus sp. GU-2018]|uniref:DNA-directed RNA polymerase subunit 6 n=1 Tax=Yasminevirus sp. GU-2018 TaxID=2420051 RepID=A0A5K0U9D5_9VIRU|nr:DNA-directed RNA polymerase subunit 6 [Yasminevirus sp. GU-2018]